MGKGTEMTLANRRHRGDHRRLGIVVLLASVLLALPALAAPLGLSPGNVIDSIEFDALLTNPPDGGSYNVATNLFTTHGRLTTVNLDPSGTTGVLAPPATFDFTSTFLSENLFINVGTGQGYLQVVLGGAPGYDVIIQQGGVNVLLGDLLGNVVASGNFALNNPNATYTAIGTVDFTAGDADVLASLGGNTLAQVLFTALVFDGDPNVLELGADNVIFNSNFEVSVSGILAPLNPAPFVPEPSTALLVGGGLLGMLGISRRMRGHS